MSQKYRVTRSIILDLICIKSDYEERNLPSSLELEDAIKRLDEIKKFGIGDA
jgi:hypothetical protein